ncbi:unnamed protein product, partial [marine sediment metagenome]
MLIFWGRLVTRNILLGAVGVVAVVLIGFTVVIGFGAERAYEQVLQNARDNAVGRYEIDGTFHRGWFSSTAETRIRIQGEVGEVLIPLEHEIIHGPLPMGEVLRGRSPFAVIFAIFDTRYYADPVQLPELADALGGRALLRVTARLGFDQSVEMLIHSPTIELDGGRFSSQGLRGDIDIADGGKRVDGSIHLGPVKYVDGEATGKLAGSTLEFETIADSTAVGATMTGRLDVDEIRLDGKAMKVHFAPSVINMSGSPSVGWAGDGSMDVTVGEIRATPTDDQHGEAIVLRGATLSQRSERAEDT